MFRTREKACARWVPRIQAGCIAAAVLVGASSLSAVPRSAGPAELQQIGLIRKLHLQAGAPAPRVHIRGVVTYFDRVAPNLFVQDATGGIWVDLRGSKVPPPKPGETVDMQGTAGEGFSPYIANPTWTVTGKGSFPAPLRLSTEQASTGAYDSQWAELEGVVRSFVQQAEGDVLVMDVATPTGTFKVRVPEYRAAMPIELVDAKVRFRGVCASAFNQRNQLVAVHLMVPAMDQLKVLTPQPAAPFSINASPIASIRRFSSDAPDIHRVKVTGVVTARFPGIGLYVADATGGVWVETQDGAPVHPGDEVQVLGFPSAGDFSPVLRSGAVHPTGRHIPVTAVALSGKEALRGGHDVQLVKIRGVVRSHYRRMQTEMLALESTDHIPFEASLKNWPEGSELPEVGSTVELTGICTVNADENGNPSRFELVLRKPSDVGVISKAPWLTTRRAFSAIGLLMLCIAAALGWLLLLRRRVRHQTSIIARDVQEKLALEDRYRRIFERNITGLYVAQQDGAIQDCNEAFARILGFSSREDLLKNRADAERLLQQFQLQSRSEEAPFEHCFQRADGKPGWALTTARYVPSGTGQVVIEGAMVDITDRKLADERIQKLALYDGLTGLANRSLLNDRLAHAIARAARRKEMAAVIFLDLDWFKNVNDSLGHSCGDDLLKAVAERLQECARQQDTVARLGGDEFIILIDGLEHRDEVSQVATRILSEMSVGFTIGDRSLNISCSVGISLYPDHGKDVETLIKNSDAAMYCAKDAGRNTARFFNLEMTEQAMERLNLENSLREAFRENQLTLAYQPAFDLRTKAMVACEALLRWDHPELGSVSPDRFIPIAESTGLIVPMGEWVLRCACMQAIQFHKAGILNGPVAVNVSAVQVRSEGFCERVRTILRETGVRPEWIELELTESLFLSGDEWVERVLGELRSIGVTLALDDFGTGYSSLSYLKHFPIQKLKIDRSFVNDVRGSSRNSAILQAVVQMAKALHMRVTAEGVETEEQLAYLRKIGCDEVQGFLLCRPVPAEAVAILCDGIAQRMAEYDASAAELLNAGLEISWS